MQLKRFYALCDAFGADLNRWPEAEREDAALLLAKSAEAGHYLAETAQLDEAIELDKNSIKHDHSAAKARILAATDTPRNVAPESPTLFVWMRYAGALSIAALLIVMLVSREAYMQDEDEMSSANNESNIALELTEREEEYLFGSLSLTFEEEYL